MGPATEADTVVVGLGNPILSDDAAGLRVAAAVQELLRDDPVPGVRVLMSTRAGFELIDLLAGARRAILIDTLDVAEPVPGRVRRLDLQQVAGAARLVGAHDISVSVAFELAASLGVRMPEAIEIYGIEGAEMLSFGEELTPAVEASVGTLAHELHERLKKSCILEAGS